MTSEQKATAFGAAAGTGIALVAGGSFGEVVGAGLVGGAAGDSRRPDDGRRLGD